MTIGDSHYGQTMSTLRHARQEIRTVQAASPSNGDVEVTLRAASMHLIEASRTFAGEMPGRTHLAHALHRDGQKLTDPPLGPHIMDRAYADAGRALQLLRNRAD